MLTVFEEVGKGTYIRQTVSNRNGTDDKVADRVRKPLAIQGQNTYLYSASIEAILLDTRQNLFCPFFRCQTFVAVFIQDHVISSPIYHHIICSEAKH